MSKTFDLVKPRFAPPLDATFRPAVLANRAYQKEVADSGAGVPLVLGLERSDGALSRFETAVFPEGHPRAQANLRYVERIVKFLLWQRGGWKMIIGGPESIGAHIKALYAPEGGRAFDYHFMGEDVYGKSFTIVSCAASDVPPEKESSKPLGRHLDGCRIGFDLGASDRKVSAVIDGEPVYSEEVVWEPRIQSDPDYHYREVMAALKMAASKMPRVDAIGGSSAGVYVDNCPRVASLFRGVPEERYAEIRNLFLRIKDEMQIPFEIINDGDVT
ncbi:MAG: ROK family protein, partial [Gammaproteobacteria bacterium]|nr:ROK family protein [Gammaproteobacteria bacterium]